MMPAWPGSAWCPPSHLPTLHDHHPHELWPVSHCHTLSYICYNTTVLIPYTTVLIQHTTERERERERERKERSFYLKGSCNGQLTFYMSKSSFCRVQRHIFIPMRGFLPLHNRQKPKILALAVHWKVATRKNIVHWKLATRKNIGHWKVATRKILCIENRLLEKKSNDTSFFSV